jgi:hypothetical protein
MSQPALLADCSTKPTAQPATALQGKVMGLPRLAFVRAQAISPST